jgi:hypothetical protein
MKKKGQRKEFRNERKKLEVDQKDIPKQEGYKPKIAIQTPGVYENEYQNGDQSMAILTIIISQCSVTNCPQQTDSAESDQVKAEPHCDHQ